VNSARARAAPGPHDETALTTTDPTAITRKALARELTDRCGVVRGGVLIVHASLRAIGRVVGGPQAVVEALIDALGSDGTLLMPVFSNPVPGQPFDLRNTPSRTGLITETFRQRPGVVRSLHPTHSVAALGPLAEQLTADHARTSGLGVDSPFHKAAEAGARVLMIGCDLRACSLIHVAEAIARVPYLGRVWYPGYDATLTVIDGRGQRFIAPPIDPPIDSQGFTVVEEELDRRGQLSKVVLGEARCLLFDGSAALDAALHLLGRDPLALLCDNPQCPVCPAARRIVRG
jgi:aminoglycoside 3-N-acetyltransferase